MFSVSLFFDRRVTKILLVCLFVSGQNSRIQYNVGNVHSLLNENEYDCIAKTCCYLSHFIVYGSLEYKEKYSQLYSKQALF